MLADISVRQISTALLRSKVILNYVTQVLPTYSSLMRNTMWKMSFDREYISYNSPKSKPGTLAVEDSLAYVKRY